MQQVHQPDDRRLGREVLQVLRCRRRTRSSSPRVSMLSTIWPIADLPAAVEALQRRVDLVGSGDDRPHALARCHLQRVDHVANRSGRRWRARAPRRPRAAAPPAHRAGIAPRRALRAAAAPGSPRRRASGRSSWSASASARSRRDDHAERTSSTPSRSPDSSCRRRARSRFAASSLPRSMRSSPRRFTGVAIDAGEVVGRSVRSATRGPSSLFYSGGGAGGKESLVQQTLTMLSAASRRPGCRAQIGETGPRASSRRARSSASAAPVGSPVRSRMAARARCSAGSAGSRRQAALDDRARRARVACARGQLGVAQDRLGVVVVILVGGCPGGGGLRQPPRRRVRGGVALERVVAEPRAPRAVRRRARSRCRARPGCAGPRRARRRSQMPDCDRWSR